ncbi:MAG: hybrid sensor histidine kinase/response regulator [Leptolyngbyaceae cyanobacterium RU_5_1]|nr:hybrid sensor histidine kinase/response regulator [Leptolyngbyaceae cyanobacterium RU_5_1]
MLLQNIRLRELTQAVPVCSHTAALITALELFSHSQNTRLVIVDDQQHPTGLVNLQRLFPCLVQAQSSVDAIAPDTEITLHTSLQAITPAIIEPLVVVPDEWQVRYFLSNLNPQSQFNYAVVDREGRFLGLLDTDCLLQALADSLAESLSDPGLNTHPSTAMTAQSPEPIQLSIAAIAGELGTQQSQQQRQIIQLTQQLLAQRSELEQRIKAQQEEINYLRVRQNALLQPELLTSLETSKADTSLSSDLTLFNSLLELLERLPLPLMLQTNSGQVLGQNSIWREQIGELLDPSWVRREAAVWLNGSQLEAAALERKTFNTPERHSFSSAESSSDSINPSTPDPVQARLSAIPGSTTPSNQGICHLGSTPGTCICICPLKDGREQIVQFVKIPFGTLQPNWHLDWFESALDAGRSIEQPSESHLQALSHPFRLATLTLKREGDGSSSEVESSAASMELGDRPPSHSPEPTPQPAPEMLWLVLAQDVTEQQQLARELTAKNADLVQLNRLKDEFLACISHELKTPLTAVLGLSSLLKDQTLGALNQRQVHYAQLIYQSSRHLMSVVNDILDLTRIETGQLELLYEPINIATVCSRAFEQAKQQRLLENKSNDAPLEEHFTSQFSLEIEPGLESIVADELRLRQMLVHLLSNALKFTEISNPIGLRVNRWGGWIAFTVWDTGIGIAAEKQHLIFQKFQQLENPLTRRFEGAGLGLVLTRRLTRLHGGDVTFISKEGQGSQFTVLLPPSPPEKTQLTRGGEQGDEDASWTATYPGGRVPLYSQHDAIGASFQSSTPSIVSGASRRSRLILIVEAIPQLIEALTDQLTGLGYRVVIARSGTEALEKARRLQPCIIFLNPLLPLLSGWDVLTLLKSNQETQHIPIVVTATKVDEELARLSLANDFLSLPVQTKILQQTLQQLLNQTDELESRSRPSNSLTILHLYSAIHSHREQSGSGTNLNQLLQLHRCRILESDDLDQAELLARVWKPNVILLDGTIPNPTAYLQQLNYHTFLSALPLVTLNQEITQAANQIPGLMVFPCLTAASSNPTADSTSEIATLLQVIQIAAGFVWGPLILAVDMSALSISADVDNVPGSSDHELDKFPKETEWLQALMQYLQAAGFRGLIGHSWQEVLEQVQSQSVDLLIICWTRADPDSAVLNMISTLRQLETKPPVIVLDHRYHDRADQSAIPPLPESVSQLAAQVLSPPLSITELLDRIHQVILKDEG